MKTSFVSVSFVAALAVACGASSTADSSQGTEPAVSSSASPGVAATFCKAHCSDAWRSKCEETVRPFNDAFLVALDHCKDAACIDSATASLKRGSVATDAANRYCSTCKEGPTCASAFFGEKGDGATLGHAADAEVERIVTKCLDAPANSAVLCAASFAVCAAIENPDLKLGFLADCK